MFKTKEAVCTTVKKYTVKELSKVEVPGFQRWIVESNKKELESSILSVGLLRLPVIFHVKSQKKDYIIDGNHLRLAIVDTMKPSDEVFCIYREVDFFEDAIRAFVLMNTKGKKLDLVDFTHLYKHTTDGITPNVYKQVWAFLGNPENKSQVKTHKLFSVPTIVEIIAGDKGKYINGETSIDSKNQEFYLERVALLEYLLGHSYDYFKLNLDDRGFRMPSGAAMIGFVRAWLGKEGLSKKYTKDNLLAVIVTIYKDNNKIIRNGTLTINRDNSGKLLLEQFNK
jgi:hypothetical protein